MPSDSCLNLTATGIDSHTLTASVKVDTVSGGNALVKGPNGLYCPAPGSAAATTIQTSPTVIATLINPTTYSLAVDRSTDSCNALVLGNDNALYVNGVPVPYALNFYVDGSDVFFQFQGPSTNNLNYEVELQGTTGSPQLWVTGTFDSLNGVILVYGCTNTTNEETVTARVRYKCGTNVSEWVSETYIPQHSYVSDSGTISIAPAASGIVGQYTIDRDCTCTQSSPGLSYTACGRNYITISVSSIPAGIVSLQYEFKKSGSSLYGQGEIAGENGSYRLPSSVPIVSGENIQVRFRSVCDGGCVSAWGAFFGHTVTFESAVCTTEWTSIPSGSFVSGAGYVTTDFGVPYANPIPSYYRNINGEFKLAGDCIVTTTLAGACNTGGTATGWIDIIDITGLNCNPIVITNEDYGVIGFGSLNGLVDYECGLSDSLAPSYQTIYARRRNNMIQVNIVSQDMQSVTSNFEIPLSALNINL